MSTRENIRLIARSSSSDSSCYYLNVEFEWPSDLLPEVPPVEGSARPVTVTHIRKTLDKIKQGKAAGPSGVISEMLKAAGEEGLEMLRLLAELVFSCGDG